MNPLSQSIFLRGAKQVLTLRGTPGVRRGPDFGNLEIIEDGSVFIQDGKIVSVGPTRRLENLKETRSAMLIPVPNCVIMPGFVDPAIRLSLMARDSRGLVKRRRMSDFFNESIALMRSCLLHGSLNVGINACSGVGSMGADLSVLRQLARIGNNPVGLTRVWRPQTDHENMPDAQMLSGALRTISKQKLAGLISMKTNADGAVRDSLVAAASEAEIPLNLDWPGGPAAQLKEMLDRSEAAAVMCRHSLSKSECEVLAQANATTIFNAGSALLENQPDNCLRELLDAGGAIALGSGYDAHNELNFNMQLVLSIAVLRLHLTIEQAITATTINAAHALNCGDQFGSLEPGKRAEVMVLNIADYREIPRRLGVNHVAMAIRDGNLAINRTRWKVGAA